MKILLVTDAWEPQVNGVVRTLRTVARKLESLGHAVLVVSPDLFKTIPCPTYPEIRLAVYPWGKLKAMADYFLPDAIHIATEGPLGICARYYCTSRGIPFTTSFHTRFPEYIQARFKVPLSLTYRSVKWFHSAASRVMVATPTVRKELAQRGFKNTVQWSRGVNTELFRPRPKTFLNLPRPVLMYVGRVAVEKNLEAFLNVKHPGTKVVVGDGPRLEALKSKFPAAVFVGEKRGEELAAYHAAADVFVFPSKTDTFGLVMLEALASGVPVAAYPVPGPIDVITSPRVGCLDNDLSAAVVKALALSPEDCRRYAQQYSWKACAKQFLSYLQPFRGWNRHDVRAA